MAEVIRLPLHLSRQRPNCIRHFRILALIIAQIILSATVDALDHCGLEQFACKDGTCIPHDKLCNGRFDCSDNSDEMNCDYKMCRKPNWFQCTIDNGPCLTAELACNGVENCPGGEDELDCGGQFHSDVGDIHSRLGFAFDVAIGGSHVFERNCSEFEYMCLSDKSCIPLDFMCDGKKHCHDESDEVDGCVKAETKCRGFFCSNRKCLESKTWVCDGVDDCGDGSDERKCVQNCGIEKGTFPCHNNETCIPLAQVCDEKKDCSDGSDESALCKSVTNNCSSKACPPAAHCSMLSDEGATCVCPSGFRYSRLQHVCLDINECQEQYGLCSQNCENFPGGYRCKCDSGYALQADNKTCRANGEEALLLYSTQTTVMGVHLRSRRVFKVAGNLTKVIGLSYDGDSIYWTNIQTEGESIVKAKADGSEHEILLTSGLDAPEDLAVDWLTGNIYFSDNGMRHIAVCSNDGLNCCVLVTIDVHQPRGIALWPQRGQMFWTDWGTKPAIVRASMDGTKSLVMVSKDIFWPNGIALDMHNERVYWVDAKFAVMESVRPDGTDRRIVLQDILKHPYGLAIFEDKLYWSDWATRSIHTCNKFTGKDHKVVAKDRTSYAVHIYHSAKQPKIEHDCMKSRCTHLCLLAENNSSTCACPEGMQLSSDHRRCTKAYKRQRLFIALRNTITEIEHTTFGRHVIKKKHQLSAFVSEMVYNNVNGTIIIADNFQKVIWEYDLETNLMTKLTSGHLGNVTAMAFDHYAYNIYWTDSERHVVEVLSLRTKNRAIVSFYSGLEAPVGIAVLPEEGTMFVALKSRRHIHIDQQPLNGQGEHVHVFEDELGHREIKLIPDYSTKTLYWSDSEMGRISSTDYSSMHTYTFRSRLRRPYSLAIVDDDIFWSELKSTTIHWTHKSYLGPIKQFDLDFTKDGFIPHRLPLVGSTPPLVVDHPCQHNNGGCSHVCINLGRYAESCLCPPGLVFSDTSNRTCIEALDCEFRCQSGECLTQSRRCNGRKDCPDGSDEKGCDEPHMKSSKVICTVTEYPCQNGKQCVSNEKRCNGVKDCKDGSDEQHCEKFDKKNSCHHHQHSCENGRCVDLSTLCDDNDDCGDFSDEKNCKNGDEQPNEMRPVCDKNMFQCNVGTCIPKSWECDGKIDCTDSSDEHEKCDMNKCSPNMHVCLLGQCIDQKLVCDGHNDCGDHSDEINCDEIAGKKLKMNCGDPQHPMFQCPSERTICLELAAKCNGTAECPRGEDEADCDGMCSIYEFQCKKSRECIRKTFLCDHEKDCADGSDEQNCSKFHNSTKLAITTTHEQLCGENMFDCKDGRCVDMSRVCDDFLDCETGLDESPLCKTACQPSAAGRPICKHKCRPSPAGAVCSCFHGYRLDADKRTCVDVNECEERHPCAQLCENTIGSYRCKCFPEFMLATDKTTCKSIESDYKIMFSTFNEVRSMSKQPIVYRVTWSANDSKIVGFDLNVRKRRAYFTTEGEDALYEVDLDTGVIKDALIVENPTKVAADWITDNVYVISRTKRYEIKVCSFKAKMCGSIIRANPRETIKALTFDAFNQKLFYVSVRAQLFGIPTSQINVVKPDGKRQDLLLNRKIGFINVMATDPDKKMLYFVDSHTKTLEAISYSTARNTGPLIIKQKSGRVMHPSGLTVYENRAYLVNIGAKEAVYCQLYGSYDCEAFNLNVLNAEDIVIDGSSRQPLATNPCEWAKCSGMCLQSEFSYECMCGDEFVTEDVTCPKHATNAILANAMLLKSSPDLQSTYHPHTTATVMLSLLFVGLLVFAVGYLYYRRYKQSHHRDFNINLHFQNPLSSKASNGKSTVNDSASFNAKEEALQPIHRYLGEPSSITGMEVFVEPANKRAEFRTLEQARCVPNTLVGYDSDYNATSGDGNYASDDDDARTRLFS